LFTLFTRVARLSLTIRSLHTTPGGGGCLTHWKGLTRRVGRQVSACPEPTLRMLALFAFHSTRLGLDDGAPPNPCTHAECVPVFYSGLNGSRCYRIPSIIQTHKGTLLAFAENRLTGCGDGGQHTLVVRRSLDFGLSWGPMITAVRGETPCPGCPAAVSNPNPVEVTFPNGTRSILLAFDTMNNPSAAHHGLDKVVWSGDDGLTWIGERAVSFPPESNTGSLIGPAVGLQAADGTLIFWLVEGQALIMCARQLRPCARPQCRTTWHGAAPLPTRPAPSSNRCLGRGGLI
jgi:hypothetical protein